VRSKDEMMKIIIPHFEKYPLITKKHSDFLLFKNILKIMNKNEHLGKDGLINIINLRASLNKGLSTKLKTFFSDNVKFIKRSEVIIPINIDYN
jgi:hypothetical protein